METLAKSVHDGLTAAGATPDLIAHGGSNRALVWWLPTAAVHLAFRLLRSRNDLVLFGDALATGALGWIPRLAGVRHATMVMGLDLTYDQPVYRWVVHRALRRCPKVIAISEATAAEARAAGVRDEDVIVLLLGVPVPDLADQEESRRRLLDLVGLDDKAMALVTLGRIVERKGARWFIEQVLPGLPPHHHYVVAGTGPDAGAVADAAHRHGLADRVHLLGAVSDEDREIVMAGADVFVQPNVRVPGDMEGFGLVTIEAALRATPVVAADLEGIKDAVIDGETGRLVEPENASAWHDALVDLDVSSIERRAVGTRGRAAAVTRFGEAAMGDRLIDVLHIDRNA